MHEIQLSTVETINGYLIGRLVVDGYIRGWAWIKDGVFSMGRDYPIRNGFGY